MHFALGVEIRLVFRTLKNVVERLVHMIIFTNNTHVLTSRTPVFAGIPSNTALLEWYKRIRYKEFKYFKALSLSLVHIYFSFLTRAMITGKIKINLCDSRSGSTSLDVAL